MPDHNLAGAQGAEVIIMILPLDKATVMAEKIVAELRPFCERIEIAGSIRRRRPQVNDIDLVLVPSDLAGLRDRLFRRCRRITDAEQTIVVETPGRVQLDVWIARPAVKDLFGVKPGNFGTLWLCRTGSREHNIWLIGHAEKMGLRWNPYHGVFDGHGKCLACAEEADIFAALELAFVPPEERS